MKRWLVLASGIIFAAFVAVGFAIALMPAPSPGHAPLHIGCKDHNHGPKWHASHGKLASTPTSRFAKPEDTEAQERENQD